MPVTLALAPHPSQPVDPSLLQKDRTATNAVRIAAPDTSRTISALLNTSLPTSILPKLVPASNGLIHACLAAYNQHHHLHIRPDDVWIVILTQFSFYVNAHAEEFREYFVVHEGKKQLDLYMENDPSPYGADYSWMANQLSKMMEAELAPGASGLKDWILPKFTTTTETDTAVMAGLMMCTLKSYFEFVLYFMCGIPSVTLLGTKEDWFMLRKRIDKFLEFGKQIENKNKDLLEWQELLGPVLDRFVETFDYEQVQEKEKDEIREFWNVICKQERFGSGGDTSMTGWLSFLCPFSEKGIWKLNAAPTAPDHRKGEWGYNEMLAHYTNYKTFSEKVYGKDKLCRWMSTITTKEIPAATAHADIIIVDNGHRFDAVFITGLAGYEVQGDNSDTLRPLPAWWMFSVDERKKEEDDRIVREREERQERAAREGKKWQDRAVKGQEKRQKR